MQETETKTTIVDAHCGKGKTSWAIQHINENPEKRFIFITPFLDEVKRIKKECPGADFMEPKSEYKSKSSHLKDLLSNESNIVSTHSLFTRVDAETRELLRMGKYTLILDEVMDIVHQECIAMQDTQMLQNEGLLVIDPDNGKVSVTDSAKTYTGVFRELIEKAQSGRLVCFNNTFLLWQFPPEVFEELAEVFLLTYLFNGQIQRCYFDYHGIPYRMQGVTGSREEGYELAPYDAVNGDRELREWLKDNLHIYDGKLNDIGGKGLSHSWYMEHRNNRRVMIKVKNAVYNYFNNVIKGNGADCMWTTYKVAQETLKGKGYTKGFVAHNARATNDYAHKKHLAYLVNRFLQPGLVNYFKDKGVAINQELFAVSELIQWVFRSAVRNQEPINLYLPSERMRRLLINWIDGSLLPQK
jgi:hypothetical protein